MHAAAKLAVGMARFAVISIVVLLMCIVGSNAQDSVNDLDYYSGSGSGYDGTDDNEDGDAEEPTEAPTQDPNMRNWVFDERFYNDSKYRCQSYPTGKFESASDTEQTAHH